MSDGFLFGRNFKTPSNFRETVKVLKQSIAPLMALVMEFIGCLQYQVRIGQNSLSFEGGLSSYA